MTLSTGVADHIAKRLAAVYQVASLDGLSYATVPVATRGIPHGFIPGIHSVLDDMVAALDTIYTNRETGLRFSQNTVNGLFVLPFSAFTQSLRPDVECTADATIRQCFRDPNDVSCATGRAYIPDATSEHEVKKARDL